MSKLQELISELCPDGVEYKPLLNEAEILYGFPCDASKFNDKKEGLPVVRIRDVLSGHTSTYTTEEVPEKYFIEKGDLLVGMDGNFHTSNWMSGKAILCQRVCKVSSKNESVVLNRFLSHLLKPMIKNIEDNKNSGTVKHLLSKDLNNILIPVPPLPVQEEIVRILDKFNSIWNDISTGLPAEIEARQKQYEYYRDKLLSFQKLENEEC